MKSRMFRGDKYVTPLYALEGDVPLKGGTGTWLSVGGERFLITAAHCIDDDFVWFPMEKGFKRIDSPGVITDAPRGRAHDRGDFAIFHLTSEDVAAMHPFWEFIDITMVAVNLDYNVADRYEFTGFPSSGESLNRSKQETVPRYASINLPSAPEAEFRRLGVDTLTHVVVKYPKTKMLKDGTRVTGPNPYGMSGGAVWKCYPDTGERKLSAIGIEYRSSCLVGTRISPILEYVRHRCPKVASMIPKPSDVMIESERKPHPKQG